MKVLLKLDGRSASGGAPLIMHNERLADPLDEFTQAIQAYSHRKKTLADHEQLGYLEFLGGLYTDPALTWPLNGSGSARVVVPAWNVLRCLQDGGRGHKRGKDVPKGVYPLAEFAAIECERPDTIEAMWQDGGFSLRKTVGVQRARLPRTRPMFVDWQAELPVEVDSRIFDIHTLRTIWQDAGVYAGLGDMRPVYGRFIATAEVQR